MNRLSLIALLLLLTTNIFGQDTIFFDSKWKITDKVNSKFYRIQKLEKELWLRTDYYSANNQIQMKGYYSSINPEIRTGYFEWFHSNGKLKHKGNYINDKEEGQHTWYFDNGSIEAVENYKLGILNGTYQEYYDNGKISNDTHFIDGKQNGYTKFFRKDGSLHSEGQYKDGDRNGEWKFYDNKEQLLGITDYKTEYILEEANLFIKLPNSQWSLVEKSEGNPKGYIFKRESIEDSLGREIIPAIMVYTEDATNYNQDAVLYSIWKQKPFVQKGVKIDKISTYEDEKYNINIKNLIIYKCSYTENNFDHILYMIHMITKNNKGVQIYLDMTKELVNEYENEFLKTINSLKEI